MVPDSIADTLAVVCHPLVSPISLKQAALLFDHIVIALGYNLRVEPEYDFVLSTYAELDYLFEKGVIVEPKVPPIANEDTEVNAAWSAMSGALETVKGLAMHDPVRSVLVDMAAFALTFAERLRLQRYTGHRATALISPRLSSAAFPSGGAPNVISIVLSAMPVPDESTPWESVLEFRNDPEAREKYLRLRHWMNAQRLQTTPPAHIVDELRFLLSEYEAYMRLHQMKIHTELLESIVTGAPEVIEQLLKFQFGKLAKGLFTFRHRQLELTEAESKAPGREVAYIVEAKHRFGEKQ